MKKLYLLAALLVGMTIGVHAQTNLIENWDGNGDNNATTSFPDKYGWAVTVGTFNYANSSAGVRWMDVTTGHTLNGATFNGRLMLARWDGSGSTALTSVYSYPVTLEANKRYTFSWAYEWWNNASVPTYTVGIGTDKTGANPIATKDFACSSTKNTLLAGDMSFFVATGGSYFVTIKANNLAVLGGIGNLSVTEIPPVLECLPASVKLSYLDSEETITISPNGSNNPITIAAPTGIALSANELPYSGGSVTVSSADSSNVTGQITVTQGTEVLNLPVSATFPENFLNVVKTDTLTLDGAWCWFADPRAIYYKGAKEQTYFSWITKDGDIVIASYDHASGAYAQKTLYKGLQVDDHANPSIFIRKDGRIILFYSKHFDTVMHRVISTNPEDITSWGTEYTFGYNVTYPYPFQVGNDIVVFYRGDADWHPTMAVSSDNGETFTTFQKFIVGGGQRPYARYLQDNTGAIHMAFTTGHPRNELTNKIYYACYKNGAFYKADGTLIKNYTSSETALNIDLSEAETVYDASKGKGWIWDITVDQNNRPVMVYASFPSDTDHRYHYARWTGTEWYKKELTSAGKWFPQTPAGTTEPEPNYSGGINMDPDDPTVVYLSKQVKGVFEIFKFTTPDQGVTWDSTAVTWNTPSNLVNVRPIVPLHHKAGYFDVIWMRGTYVYYTNYNTSLVFSAPAAGTDVTSILFDSQTMELKKGTNKQINVTFVPFLTSNKSLVWTTSDENVATVNNGLVTATGVGSATITATAPNGVKATCPVNVTLPTYLTAAYFDFGTSTSPVVAGAIQVTESTLFTDSYGWSATVLTRDRGAAASDELRDFNMSSVTTSFKLFLQPGNYRVTAKQGDMTYAHDNMSIYADNQPMVTGVASAVGAYTTSTFNVVSNGLLTFTFTDGGGTDANWVINSLNIEPLNTTPVATPNNDAVPANGNMTVYNIVGKLVYSTALNGTPYTDALTDRKLPNGIYLVKIETKNGSQTIKHLVNR